LYAGEDEHPRIGGRRAYKKERFHTLSEHLKRDLAKKHTLADMAEACACSISTVKALCHEFCGTSPNDYLISLRIERARELIREGSMNFTEIAEEVGFGSLHYFSRTFRARTGQTLTQYAKMTAG
jgi:AraC-like DNA-binding protein